MAELISQSKLLDLTRSQFVSTILNVQFFNASGKKGHHFISITCFLKLFQSLMKFSTFLIQYRDWPIPI